MTLLQFRNFITSQFGLQSMSSADINTYIDLGCKLLDTLWYGGEQVGNKFYMIDVPAGDYIVLTPSVLRVDKVSVVGPDSSGNMVNWKPLIAAKKGMVRSWLLGSDETIQEGVPAYWEFISIQLADAEKALTRVTYTTKFTYGADRLLLTGDTDFADGMKAIIIYPVPTTVMTLAIDGQHKSTTLSSDADTNSWISDNIDLAMGATRYFIENLVFRNNEGAMAALVMVKDLIKNLRLKELYASQRKVRFGG